MSDTTPAQRVMPAPRENIIRAVMPGMELRSETRDDGGEEPTLFGHFARFNEWTEIDSMWEGRFMERVAPGAFKKTLREGKDKIRLLFQHGQDPDIGDKPIGAIRSTQEDDEGAYYEASLFPGLPELVMNGLRAGQYGASFRFRVMREDWDDAPKPSDTNPRGLPERTIKEASVQEFGPVTFGAYAGATAGVRSMTDDYIMRCFAQDPERLRAMFASASDQYRWHHLINPLSVTDEAETPVIEDEDRATESDAPQDAPSEDDAELNAHLADERRDEQTDATPPQVRRVTPIHALKPRTKRQPLASLVQARKDRL